MGRNRALASRVIVAIAVAAGIHYSATAAFAADSGATDVLAQSQIPESVTSVERVALAEDTPGWRPVLIAIGFIAILAGAALMVVRRRGAFGAALLDPTKRRIVVQAVRRVGAVHLILVEIEGAHVLVAASSAGISSTQLDPSR